MTDLSVIVPTWNTRETTLRCVESVANALAAGEGIAGEVWVVDNGSRDGTADAVRARFPGARVLALPRNRGFAAACNAGLSRMRGRHALLLNSDARVLPGALETCVRFLDEHPDVGIAGPRLLRPDGNVQDSVHAFPSLATELLPAAVLSFLWPRRFPSKRSVGDAASDVPALRGAALFVRRELLDAVGPLDEDYFLFLEETDWCWRAREAGFRVAHLPAARVEHLSGASSKRRHPGATRIEYHRSLYHFLRTRRGVGRMWTVRAVRFGKSLFYAVARAPGAIDPGARGARRRARWLADVEVLRWHLRGLPSGTGLRAVSPEPGGEQ